MPTTQNSTQYGNQIAIPPVYMEAEQFYGKLRVLKFNFTQAGAGSAASVAQLLRLPAGKVMLCAGQSQIKTSAFGASRTLSLGYAAYKLQDGTTQAASAAAISSAVDVSAAIAWTPGAALADGTLTFTSRAGVLLIATVAGGTIPDLATIQGTYVIAVE
jgi:hypothetical protein